MLSSLRCGVLRAVGQPIALVGVLICGGCGGASPVSQPAGSGTLQVAVAENFWGSIVAQEAGSRARVTSVIANPNADPHAYEPTMADARLLAGAQYVVYNGAGYDPWVSKLLAANPVAGR